MDKQADSMQDGMGIGGHTARLMIPILKKCRTAVWNMATQKAVRLWSSATVTEEGAGAVDPLSDVSVLIRIGILFGDRFRLGHLVGRLHRSYADALLLGYLSFSYFIAYGVRYLIEHIKLPS